MEKRLDIFLWNLKRKKIKGAHNVAVEALQLLSIGISRSNGHAIIMLEIVRALGERMMYASPLELSIGNIVRRVLFIIREEYTEFAKEMDEVSVIIPSLTRSTSNLFVPTPVLGETLHNDVDFSEDYSEPYNIKGAVLDAVKMFQNDLQMTYMNISDQALDHIHSNEVVLTFGKSRTVEEFLKAAARKTNVKVVVAESAPSYFGREMALHLSEAGIKTTLIADNSIYAMMARVNKVIIGVHAVLANGGLLAHTGAHALALSAKSHNIPLVVLSGLYKFTPLYSSNEQDTFSDLNPPGELLPFDEVDLKLGVDCFVQNPAYDYVPPELVTLFISNEAAHNPAYIYRLLVDQYHPADLLELSGVLVEQ